MAFAGLNLLDNNYIFRENCGKYEHTKWRQMTIFPYAMKKVLT